MKKLIIIYFIINKNIYYIKKLNLIIIKICFFYIIKIYNLDFFLIKKINEYFLDDYHFLL